MFNLCRAVSLTRLLLFGLIYYAYAQSKRVHVYEPHLQTERSSHEEY